MPRSHPVLVASIFPAHRVVSRPDRCTAQRACRAKDLASTIQIAMSEPLDGWCDVVGRGRMGEALSTALRSAGLRVRGPLGRGATAAGARLVLLCVPDREIAAAAGLIDAGALVGHVSASADLTLLEPHERFSLHPLLSVLGAGAPFRGATCAIDGSTPRAMDAARALAEQLGMRARIIPAAQRVLYHAAASIAANYLVTVEGMAERVGALVGLDRAALAPLVRATLDNWISRGATAALTGPIARGDEQTVARQRAAVALAAPHELDLWDALERATRQLAVDPASSSAAVSVTS
jgi:predicted short-subunit dehydrogenase-like oxidoreductase (DUF2520 family)